MVVYINTVDVESLTGPAAIERAVNVTLETLQVVGLTTTLAHFRLSSHGITITDDKHRSLVVPPPYGRGITRCCTVRSSPMPVSQNSTHFRPRLLYNASRNPAC